MNDNVLDMPPVLSDYIANKSLINKILILPDFQKHLDCYPNILKGIFVKETYENFDWILNSFAVEKTKSSGREEG